MVLGWPNGSGGSLQSCSMWVQLPSPAPDTESKGCNFFFVGTSSTISFMFLNFLRFSTNFKPLLVILYRMKISEGFLVLAKNSNIVVDAAKVFYLANIICY
jgi:hypothetical protein